MERISMIHACGEGKEAVRTYEKLADIGQRPSRRLLLAALKACSKTRDIRAGKRIHACLIESREDRDVAVGNSLVHMYARCKSMSDARWVFDRMLYRDSVSWNALLFGYLNNGDPRLVLELFRLMQEGSQGCLPDARTFVAALKACATCAEGRKDPGCLQTGIALHSELVKGGYESDIFVASTMIDMYAKCGRPLNARLVFDGLLNPDVICWNAVLFGYTEIGNGRAVFELFTQMKAEGCLPDAVTYVAVFKACATCATSKEEDKAAWLKQGTAVHSQASEAGFDKDMMVASTLVDMYSNCGALAEARQVFDRVPRRDTVAWNAVIFGHVESGEPEIALQLFARMETDGCVPNPLTYVAVLKACGSLTSLKAGRELHARICVAGLEAVPYVATSLVDLYGKGGVMASAQQVFDSVGTRHLAMWNALVAGYADQGDCTRAFLLFDRMLEEHLQVDGFTFLSVLTLCSRAGLINKGMKYFHLMQREHLIAPDLRHYSCMVDLLCRANRVDAAISLVKEMVVQPDVAVWRTILAACQRLKNVELGELAFDAALKLDDQEHGSRVLMANIYAADRTLVIL